MTISIYIPTHNRRTLLERAVTSIQNQTYGDFEVIIVDDASSDDTEEYLSRLTLSDTRFKYIKNEKPLGACASRNIAINRATGRYITGLDDDDFFAENRLRNLFDLRHLLDEYSFISTATNLFFDKEISNHKVSFNSEEILGLDSLSKFNSVGNQVFTLTTRIRSLNGFDECLSSWQDYDMWLRLVENFGSGCNSRDESYWMDVIPQRNRISNNKNKINGIKLFLEKHSSVLERKMSSKYQAFICVKSNGELKANINVNKYYYCFYYLFYSLKL